MDSYAPRAGAIAGKRKPNFSRFLFWAAVVSWLTLGATAAFVFGSWRHPDEWFQTLELANLIHSHVAVYSQEIGLHLRNLTWPTIVAGIWSLAEAVGFDLSSAHTKLLLAQGLVALTSTAWIFALRDRFERAKVPALLLVFAWFPFVLRTGITPGLETLSSCVFALFLCAADRGAIRGAAVLAIGVAAFRYPSLLLPLGYSAGVWLRNRSVSRKKLMQILTGLLLGVGIFGAADAWFYGRPWESLWMYAQYNLFTGMSSRVFGAQPATVYLDHYTDSWNGLGLLLPLLALPALGRGIFHRDPWATGTGLYVLGHLLIAHKEPRFMAPIGPVLFVFASETVLAFIQRFCKPALAPRLALIGAASACVVFAASSIATLDRESKMFDATYFEVDALLRDHPKVCGVLTPKYANTIILPRVSYARMHQMNWDSSFEEGLMRPLRWQDRAPHDCGNPDRELLVLRFRRDIPREFNCTALSFSPTQVGTWYRCPAPLLGQFRDVRVAQIQTHRSDFGRFAELPKLGTSGDALLEIGRAAAPPPPGFLTPDFQ